MSRLSSTVAADFGSVMGQSVQGTGQGTGVWHRLQQAWVVRRERRALLSLDDRMLADVGLSRADAYRESSRTFMDLPTALERTGSL